MEFIDLSKQQQIIKNDLDSQIAKVLNHGKYIMGPEISELEELLASYVGSENCIAVSSGTDALLISLMALGVGPGDEVITTPFTWISTVEVILLAGATPVFVDIERATCNIDHNKIKRAISSKTKAIMPVSLYGQPSDMDAINKIASHYNISVIEDAAQSFGSIYKGKLSCNLSRLGCTSFFPSKPLGCYGDGGAIFTSDQVLLNVCKEIRLNGQENRDKFNRIGLPARMDTLQAAVLLAKLKIFPQEVKKRQAIGRRYNELFSAANIEHVHQQDDRTSVFAQYTIFSNERDNLAKELNSKGIPTAVHYRHPVYHHHPYMPFKKDCKEAEKASNQVLSIPMHPYLSEEDQMFIVKSIENFVSRNA